MDSFVNDAWLKLQGCVEPLFSLLDAFKSESKEKSKVFSFWVEYIDMVLVLLQFIKAERTGNWKLHLSTTAAMIPHFYSMDRVNYARWLPVYISHMNLLESNRPDVYREFIPGNHGISRSKQPFAQVWTYMALEQSVNLDSKSKGGIVGISTKENAVERWFLISHERAAITKSLKQMCGIEHSDEAAATHKEARLSRVKRDENDVQKLVATFDSGLLNNPFHIPDDRADGEALVPLTNLANGVVLPESVAIRLLGASKLGRQNMTRIQSNQTNFWDPGKKRNILTFSSVARNVTVTVESQKDKVVSINADRELFGRLFVVVKKREVN